jgi:hypothetical protein
MRHRRAPASNRSGRVLQSLAAACLLFCPAVDAAPTTIKASMSVTARVIEVDCTGRPVKIRACAPALVLRELRQEASPPAVAAPEQPQYLTPAGTTTKLIFY